MEGTVTENGSADDERGWVIYALWFEVSEFISVQREFHICDLYGSINVLFIAEKWI